MQDADDVAAALMMLRRENAEGHTKLDRVRLIASLSRQAAFGGSL